MTLLDTRQHVNLLQPKKENPRKLKEKKQSVGQNNEGNATYSIYLKQF